MALPTSTTIQNLTRCKTLPGFFPGGFCDQFIRRIPFHDATGYGQLVQINRATLGAAANYLAGGAMAAVASSAALTAFTFQRIGDTVEVDSADILSSEELQQQLDLQVEMKKVSVVRQLASQIIQGDGIAPNLAGLTTVVDATQSFVPLAGSATAPILDDYHRIMSKVCASDGLAGNGADAIVMHPRTRRQLISILETNGGGAVYSYDEDIDQKVLTFEGIPVYFSDQVATNEDILGVPTGGQVLTSVYFLKLKGPTGIRVFHQGGSSSEFGVVTEEISPQLTVAKRATTVRGFYTLVVPEIKSLSRLRAISIAGFID